MCLAYPVFATPKSTGRTEIINGQSHEVYYGFKLFKTFKSSPIRTNLTNMFFCEEYSYGAPLYLPIGEWIDEKEMRQLSGRANLETDTILNFSQNKGQYIMGFHIIGDYKTALMFAKFLSTFPYGPPQDSKFVISKVEFAVVFESGIDNASIVHFRQELSPTFVARYMKILPIS